MTYSEELKAKISNCIKLRKYTDTEIMKIFNISNRTFYKIKKSIHDKPTKTHSNSKYTRIRKTKITNDIKKYIVNYVTRKINYNYHKLINMVLNKFDTQISKSTIYNILKTNKVKKKKIYKKQSSPNKALSEGKIKKFKKETKNVPIEATLFWR